MDDAGKAGIGIIRRIIAAIVAGNVCGIVASGAGETSLDVPLAVPVIHLHRDDVEAELTFPKFPVAGVLSHPHLSHTTDLVLFAGTDSLKWFAAFVSQPRFDFDEGDDPAAPGDDVDLTVTAAVVDLENQITVMFQITAGKVFTVLS